MTARPTTGPLLSRATLLRSAGVLAGGALAGGALTSAHASPARRTAPATPRRSTSSLPSSWEGTIFADPDPSRSSGEISSLTVLVDRGPVTSLSPSALESTEGIEWFTMVEDPTEEFTANIAASAHLDGGPVEVLFAGDSGTDVAAQVSLVRSANPRFRAVLVYVYSHGIATPSLPPRTPLATGAALAETAADITKDDVEGMMEDFTALSATPDAEASAQVDQVKIMDDGLHVSGRVARTLNGKKVRRTWYGLSTGAREGVTSYLFGQLPA